ncbi:MAG: hypothetical protein U0Q11_13815 [Vicinamibacterales bacterium]
MTLAAGRRASLVLVLLATVGLGAGLRLAHLDEMEYKRDERWTYSHTVLAATTGAIPARGMPSGIAVPNAALSLLVFVGLSGGSAPDTPVALTTRVVWLNVAALLLLVAFSETGVEAHERAAWRWSAALMAVSPFAVLLERKLWAQSTLPIVSLLFLAGWFRRDRWWGSSLWGFVSAVIGQIHMSGLFYAAAFGLWTATTRSTTDPQPVSWRWWTSGFMVGSFGLLQWALELVRGGLQQVAAPVSDTVLPIAPLHAVPASGIMNWHLLSLWPSFWWNWLCDASGFGLNYSLGDHYLAFLATPSVGGHDTWLMAITAATSLVIALTAALPSVHELLRTARTWGAPRNAVPIGNTPAALVVAGGVFGVMLTATFHTIHRHYLAVLVPLPWVWLSRSLLGRRRGQALLCCVWFAKLVLTLGVLHFIHVHHGAPSSDYGIAHRWQVLDPVYGDISTRR